MGIRARLFWGLNRLTEHWKQGWKMNVTKIDNAVEYKLRVPRNLVKNYYVMKLNSPRPMQFGDITEAYISRQAPLLGEEETSIIPSSGAGSEYGKEWKEEMKKKRRGQVKKEISKEDMLYSLKLCGKKDRRFEGKKEGTILENSSYYILTQCPDGVFEAVPLQAWYNFNPTIEYHTLSLDEVEKEFSKRDKTLNYHNMMLKKRLQASEEKEEEIKAKVKSTYDDLVIHDDEESDFDEAESSDAEEKNDSNPSVKKNRKKDTYLSKKKKEAANEDEGEQDSDEEEEFDNVESKECDYMSESSSNDEAMLLEDEPEPDTDKKTKAKDDLNAFLLSDSEEEDGLTTAGKELNEILRRDEGDEDSSLDEDEDVDIDADEKYSKSALFMQGSGNKKTKSGRSGSISGSSSSSRSATPTQQPDSNSTTSPSGRKSREDLLTNRKRMGAKDIADSPSKKIKRLEGEPTDQPGSSRSTKDSKSQSKNPKHEASSSSGKEPLVITDATIRRYLSHKPMTTTDLVRKFKTKKTGLTKEQTVRTIAAIVKRIGPEKKHIDGKLYLSLKSTSKK